MQQFGPWHCWCTQHHCHRFWHATLRLHSAIRRHHPPQWAVLSQICCFGERKMVMLQILLNGAEPCDAGTTQLSSIVCRSRGQQDDDSTINIINLSCTIIFIIIIFRPSVDYQGIRIWSSVRAIRGWHTKWHYHVTWCWSAESAPNISERGSQTL